MLDISNFKLPTCCGSTDALKVKDFICYMKSIHQYICTTPATTLG